MESLLTLPQSPVARPSVADVWRQPLDGLTSGFDRLLCRSISTLALHWILEIQGLEHIAPERDPFILALNHSSRLEAVLLPILLMLHRRGHHIRFLADWPMMLVPGVAFLYRRGHVILVTRKKPRFASLDRLKRRIVGNVGDAFGQCQEALQEGSPLGLFPEATMNRHPGRLLRGQSGAARLSLATGAPIVPAGIRFPDQQDHRPIRDFERMVVEIGSPIAAEEGGVHSPPPEAVRQLHHRMMREIARLSGKDWTPQARRRRERDVASEQPDR
jgi:1-acyl-sn-glycerol-3-phosphate acyltransferase